jgi:hypothetical protein
MISLFVALMHFLDGRSIAALKTLRPSLTATEAECRQLLFRLSNMPAWPAVLASVFTVALIYLLGLITGVQESSIAALAASPATANLLLVVYYIGWWIFGAFIYHTIHQLRVINRIYTDLTRVNLFALSPLYAFSPITALTAVTLVISAYGWTALNPDNLSNPISVAVLALITVLALVAFAWPLLGIRRLMAQMKAEKLDEVALRLEGVFADLHQRIDERETKEVDALVKFISVLETERDTLKGISTWPWQPEVLRSLVSALLLPLVLWIIQYVIQLLAAS